MKRTPLIAGSIALFLGATTITGIHQAETEKAAAETACTNAKAAYVAGYKADVRALELSELQTQAQSACGYFEGVQFADPVEELQAAERKAKAAEPVASGKLSEARCEELEGKWAKYQREGIAAAQRGSFAVEAKLNELRDATEDQIYKGC